MYSKPITGNQMIKVFRKHMRTYDTYSMSTKKIHFEFLLILGTVMQISNKAIYTTNSNVVIMLCYGQSQKVSNK